MSQAQPLVSSDYVSGSADDPAATVQSGERSIISGKKEALMNPGANQILVMDSSPPAGAADRGKEA